MANIFIDTNFLFDITVRDKKKVKFLQGHTVYLSPLSIHVYFYTLGIKIPNKILDSLFDNFEFASLSKRILKKAMEGPTKDLEDNIRLHSAVNAECGYFLTSDRKLLKLGFFGRTKIVSKI